MSTWQAHVKAYRKKHPTLTYQQCQKNASKSYKKKKVKPKRGGKHLFEIPDAKYFRVKTRKRGKGPVLDLLTGKAGTAVRNLLNRHPKSRPLYPGEKHAIILTGKYKGSSYNWMGPGTQAIKRAKRGDPGINKADDVAKIHDMAYVAMKNLKGQALIKAESKADRDFLRDIKKHFSIGPEVKIGYAAILAKHLGQLAGKIPWGGSPV